MRILSYLLCFCCCGLFVGAYGQEKPYRGYRMYVANIKTKSIEPEFILLEVDMFNTGKEDINLRTDSIRQQMVFSYDQSLERNALLRHRERLEAQILEEKLKLKVGKSCSNMLLRVPFEKSSSSTQKTPKREDDSDSSPKTGATFTTAAGVSQSGQPEPRDKGPCFDLTIERVEIIRQTKKFVEVNITVRNIGQGTADLYGQDADMYQDNLTVKAYISGAPILSRGAINIGGLFVDAEAKDFAGKLAPNASFDIYAKFDLRKKTRYLNQFILALDALLMADDCDRTNDVLAILLRS